MPMTANVGVSRKVADNNFGSRGCSVNLQVELDSSLIQEPQRLQDRIRQVFRMAQESVDEELARQSGTGAGANGNSPAASGNGNGHQNGNGHTAPRRSNARRATASQARALRSVAERQGIDLAAELHSQFGVREPEQLSITEASQMIDTLKSAANGHGGRQ